MNTTNSNNHVSRISSKARWARMAAVVAVAGLGMTAPFASAGPVLVLSDNIKVIDSIKITAFLLDINGPDVITIKANEAHLLSEYFSISKTTVDFAFIAAAGGVKIFPGDANYLGFPNDTASTDLLSSSIKISAPGSVFGST